MSPTVINALLIIGALIVWEFIKYGVDRFIRKVDRDDIITKTDFTAFQAQVKADYQELKNKLEDLAPKSDLTKLQSDFTLLTTKVVYTDTCGVCKSSSNDRLDGIDARLDRMEAKQDKSLEAINRLIGKIDKT